MAVHQHRATFNGITFNSQLIDTDATLDPEDPAGLVSPAVADYYQLTGFDDSQLQLQDYRELRQWMEGADPNQSFEGPRILTLPGVIWASDKWKLDDSQAALVAAFSPAVVRLAAISLTPPDVLPFDFKRDKSGTPNVTLPLRYYARPVIGRPSIAWHRGEGLTRRFVCRLVAFDPRALSQTEVPTALGNLAGGNNTVANNGNVYASPFIDVVLSGAGHAAFTITNTTTGYALVCNLSTLGAGTFTIDVARCLFTKSDGTNVLTTRVSGFLTNLFLVPGNNTITVTGNTNLTSVTFRVRDSYA